MIGRTVINSLLKRRADILCPSHQQCDLLDINNLRKHLSSYHIDYVVNCCGYNGNIQFNQKYPADIYYQTVQMNLNVLKFCQEQKVKKVVSILSSCSYADGSAVLEEKNFWNGLPHETVECHGLAKRTILAYSRQLHKQYGLTVVSVVLNNSYGPYDSFDINKTKVIGGLIKKFIEAKKGERSEPKQGKSSSVICWGTGAARRSFVYSEDAAEGVVRALERYEDPYEPLNISGDADIPIRDLALLIKNIVGYNGEIEWDTSKPDGQNSKTLSTTKMLSILDWTPQTSLEDGLRKTVNWYKKERENIK